MLKVDSIAKGIVLDHIKAGKSMEIYKYLNFDRLDCTVAVIKNVRSQKFGKKDIIKIEGRIDLDLDVLGYIDPNITINTIEDNQISQKKNLSLPRRLSNVIYCKNPRCITSIEQEITHIFMLSDYEHQIYRCVYCEHKYKSNQ